MEPRPEDVRILYRNHRGEVAIRHIEVMKWHFGENEWHPGHQWLLDALDLDKCEVRTFAMVDILAWGDKAIEEYQTLKAKTLFPYHQRVAKSLLNREEAQRDGD